MQAEVVPVWIISRGDSISTAQGWGRMGGSGKASNEKKKMAKIVCRWSWVGSKPRVLTNKGFPKRQSELSRN